MANKKNKYDDRGRLIRDKETEDRIRRERQAAREQDLQDIFNEVETGRPNKLKGLATNTNLTGQDKIRVKEYIIKNEEWRKIAERERKEAEKEALSKKKRDAYLAQRDFNKHIGNYQARDFTSHITSWTASQVIRKPYNRSGLRSEFVSRGYTDADSGMPAADYKNRTTNLVKGRVKGTLDIGSAKVKKGLTPSIVPNLNFILGNPASSQIGSGNVIMPIAVMKWKKRGGKFKRDDWWL